MKRELKKQLKLITHVVQKLLYFIETIPKLLHGATPGAPPKDPVLERKLMERFEENERDAGGMAKLDILAAFQHAGVSRVRRRVLGVTGVSSRCRVSQPRSSVS